jgi:WASH complex subunit 7
METSILEVFTANDLLAVEGYIKDLSQVASIEESLCQVCDCSFLYFYRDMFPQFLSTLYRKNMDSAVSHTQLVLSAFSDPERILMQVRHLERDPSSGVTPCLSGYQNFILNVLKEEFVGPICEMIETDLR